MRRSVNSAVLKIKGRALSTIPNSLLDEAFDDGDDSEGDDNDDVIHDRLFMTMIPVGSGWMILESVPFTSEESM